MEKDSKKTENKNSSYKESKQTNKHKTEGD